MDWTLLVLGLVALALLARLAHRLAHDRTVQHYRGLAQLRTRELRHTAATLADVYTTATHTPDADPIDEAQQASAALLNCQRFAGSMSYRTATRRGMTRQQWETARHVLLAAQVVRERADGSHQLRMHATDASRQVRVYLRHQRAQADNPSYVTPF